MNKINTNLKTASACSRGKEMTCKSSAITHATEVLQNILQQVDRRTQLQLPTGWMLLSDVITDFKIDDDIFNKMIFRESLLITYVDDNPNNPTPIGGLSLDVQAARGNPFNPQVKMTRKEFRKKKFLVHLSSQLEHNSNNGGSRITSWLDRELQTLEEKRREYIRERDKCNEKHLYCCTLPDYYYVRKNKIDEIAYNPKKVKNLVNEGANFVLMRYLAITRFIGTFEVCTLYINGDLCRCIYQCKGPSSGFVNNIKLDVCKIYRTIIEKCGLVHKCATLLTLQGQIIRQEWKDCLVALQINPLADIKNEKPQGNLKIPLERVFMNDLELLSRYLDSKTVSKKMIESYMHDHSEVKKMIADYVQSILQLKPENIIEFTGKYFLSFSPEVLPRTEYFEPDTYHEEDDGEFWKYF